MSKLESSLKEQSEIYILIPAYCPDYNLVKLVNELDNYTVIVVNDGSGRKYEKIFDELLKIKNCIIVQHAINLGKGRAIKSGLNYILNNFGGNVGVVTADADGQHLSCDIEKIAQALKRNPNNLILGCRNFQRNIPLRSKLGNIITKWIFRFMVGVKVSDTQTGLRGIPAKFIKKCLELGGEKYEYEINMLISVSKLDFKINEEKINTVYINNNKSSHFSPVLDSFRIYFVLFRFLLSSLTTSLIDFLVFYFCISTGLKLFTSTIIARIIAGNYNFHINKKYVFKRKSKFLKAYIKYWSLVLLLGLLSYVGINFFKNSKVLGIFSSKLIVESILFLFSFTIQRDFIFFNKKDFEE